ncbi:glycine receptor subunit alpha-1-like [Hyalella azteca]|uniref:Glycine receptor subunit alpha-1-like n=1 Tax=Hyalella azteca TaxID=294128 RepID=A0A979FWW2_HYAAZ|nr:glycine receptor subunit alpha-1-like [Hyalella azteca]
MTDYHVDLYLRQTWVDQRLNHADIDQPLDLNDPNLVKAIWKPEVYFPNAKHAEFQFVTVPNVIVRINPHGEILYMLRLKLLFSCMLELSKFPLDAQICTMEVASLTTLLTVSTKSSDIQEGLPQVSYVKAIDVWMGACTAFVFCALLEFTLVNYMWRKRPQPKLPNLFGLNGGRVAGRSGGDICTSCKEKKGNDSAIFPSPNIALSSKLTDEALAALPLQLVASLASNSKRRVHAIDSNCRVLFPLSFMFFNVNWCYYLL